MTASGQRVLAVLAVGLLGLASALALWSGPSSAAVGPACTVHWASSVDGDWNVAANWSTGAVPLEADDVCIDVAGTYRVTPSSRVSIHSLTLGGASGTQTLSFANVNVTGVDLDLAATSTILGNGVLQLESSVSVDGVGSVVNQGILRFSPGGERYFGPSLTNAAGGTVHVHADLARLFSPQVVNDGSFVVHPGAQLSMGGASFASNAGSTIDVGGAFTAYRTTFTQAGGAVSGGPIVFEGESNLVDSSGPGAFVFRGQFNQLTGTIPSGQMVTVEGRAGGFGATDLQGMVTNNGTLQLDAVDSAASLNGPGSLTNNGTLRTMGSGTGFRIIAVDVTNAASGTLEVGGPSTMFDPYLDGGTMTNDGTISVTPAGGLFVAESTFVSNPGSTLDVAGGGTAVVHRGTFRQVGGAVSGGPVVLRNGSTLDDSAGPGSFVLEPGEAPNVLRGALPHDRLVTVLATAEGDSTATLAGPLVVNDGVLRLVSSAPGRAAVLAGAPLTNNGWLAMMPGEGQRHLRVPVTNSGELTVGATTLVDAGTSIMNDGLVSLEDDVDLVFSAGSFTNGPTGTLRVTVNPAAADPASRVSMLGGTATASLGGTLDVVTLGVPVVGRTYTPVAVTSRTGTFTTLTSGVPAYQATYSPTGVSLTSTPPRARFVPVTPDRILDTRTGNGTPLGRIPAGGVVSLAVAGRGGLPVSGASAVVLTVTGVDSSPGFVTVWPTGTPRPTTSNLNMTRTGQTIAVQVIVPIGSDGSVALFTSGGGHLLADVAGWYENVAASTSGRFSSIAPSRVLDTRTGTGAAAGRRGPGSSVTLPVTGRAGVPASEVSSVVLSVTSVDSSPGFLTVWSAGQERPTTSNLNIDFTGQTHAAHVVVPVGTGGSVNLFTSGGGHLLVDVVGWFTDSSAADSASGLYVALSPTRRLDTRTGLGAGFAGPRAARSTLGILLGGSDGIPTTGVAAVVATVTAVDAAPLFLTAWAGGSPQPNASNLNVTLPGDTVPNLVTSPVGAGASLNLYTDGASHLLLDLAGYYQT